MPSPVFMLVRPCLSLIDLVCPTRHLTGLLPHQSSVMLPALPNFWGCRHLLTSLGKHPVCSTVLSYRAWIEGLSIAVPPFSVPVSLSPSAPPWPLHCLDAGESFPAWIPVSAVACQQHVRLLGPQPTHCWLHTLDYYFERWPVKLRRISSSFSCSWLWFRAKDMKGAYRGLALVPSPYQYFDILSLVAFTFALVWFDLCTSLICVC